jgi:hypothetical protein
MRAERVVGAADRGTGRDIEPTREIVERVGDRLLRAELRRRDAGDASLTAHRAVAVTEVATDLDLQVGTRGRVERVVVEHVLPNREGGTSRHRFDHQPEADATDGLEQRYGHLAHRRGRRPIGGGDTDEGDDRPHRIAFAAQDPNLSGEIGSAQNPSPFVSAPVQLTMPPSMSAAWSPSPSLSSRLSWSRSEAR